MAEPTRFPESNTNLAPPTPEDAAAGTVVGLPAYRYRDLDGNPNVLSCWVLTDAELAEVIATRRVWFNAWGTTHAPIWLSGHNPFNKGPANG